MRTWRQQVKLTNEKCRRTSFISCRERLCVRSSLMRVVNGVVTLKTGELPEEIE